MRRGERDHEEKYVHASRIALHLRYMLLFISPIISELRSWIPNDRWINEGQSRGVNAGISRDVAMEIIEVFTRSAKNRRSYRRAIRSLFRTARGDGHGGDTFQRIISR